MELLDKVPAAQPYTGPGSAGPTAIRPTRLSVDGLVFKRDGQVHQPRSLTSFLLYQRFLRGDDITEYLGWAQSLALATCLRVLGMVKWAGYEFGPETPGYWDKLPDFLDRCGQAGFNVELTPFADAQYILPDPEDQRRHARRIQDVVRTQEHVVIEWCNEPFKNGVTTPWTIAPQDRAGIMTAYGNYDIDESTDPATLRGADYVTLHPPRDTEWPRKMKDALELRDGYGAWFEGGDTVHGRRHPAFLGVKRPVWIDEAIGTAEFDSGARTTNADDFYWGHANGALMAAGVTVHSESGLHALVPGPKQQACIDAALAGMAAIPPEAQTWNYTRGGLGDLPIAWGGDGTTLRTYGKIGGTKAVVLAIRPSKDWSAVPVNGWRITGQTGPQGSVVYLER